MILGKDAVVETKRLGMRMGSEGSATGVRSHGWQPRARHGARLSTLTLRGLDSIVCRG
jgi:hypothetical protein